MKRIQAGKSCGHERRLVVSAGGADTDAAAHAGSRVGQLTSEQRGAWGAC